MKFTNGLLLRADIHTLLDLRLIVPDPATGIIVISKLLVGTQYEVLSGCRIATPAAEWQRPSEEALDTVWRNFLETEGEREGRPA